MFQVIAAKYNLPVSAVKHIYDEYLKLISKKAKQSFEELKSKDIQSMQDIYYNRGNYCFYLRYLGKYYINYKAYLKWKSKISKK